MKEEKSVYLHCQTADCENFQNILTVWAAKNMNGIILLLTILTICAAVKSFTMI